jgi:hypothetical protein
MTTTAIPGYGSKLSCSLDGSTYTAVAQLRKITPQGSKQTVVDQTNILTPGNGAAPLAARFDSGEINLEGVLAPADGSQIELGTVHANLTLAWWKLLLSDGITVWTWRGFLSEFVPFTIEVAKAMGFTAKIRVQGALTGPAGAV